MGGDLLEDYGIVPISLRLGIVPLAPEAGRLAAVPEDMSLVLHLADGTALAARFAARAGGAQAQEGSLAERSALEGWAPAGLGDAARRLRLLPAAAGSARQLDRPQRGGARSGGARTLDLRGSLVSLELSRWGERASGAARAAARPPRSARREGRA
jgi:hypothetical protein